MCLVVGLSASLAAREQIARGEQLWRGTHLLGVLFMTSMVVVPFGAYLFFSHPSWSLLYWLDPLDISPWHSVWIFLGAPLAGAVGYLLGGILCRFFQPLVTAATCGFALIGLLIAAGLSSDRLLRLSDSKDWQEAPSVLSGDLAVIFAFALPMLLGAWVFLLALYEVEGRKLVRASGIQAAASRPASHPLAGIPDRSAPAPSSGLLMPDLRSAVSSDPAAGSNKER